METIYAVYETEKIEDGMPCVTSLLGTFTTKQGAVDCLKEAGERIEDDWLKCPYEESTEREDWVRDTDTDTYSLRKFDCYSSYRAEIRASVPQAEHRGYSECLRQMGDQQRKVYGWALRHVKPREIVQGARKGNEKPYGWLSDYLKDMFGMAASESALVAEAVIKRYGIDNDYCPWLEEK